MRPIHITSRISIASLAVVAVVPLSVLSAASAALAYEGYGYQTVGGQGGSTCHVTTLASSGSGSLYNCVTNRSGPRIVVFDVAGTIVPADTLYIRDPYITIDGTTAPSPGITIRPSAADAGSISAFVIESTHDVIIRGLRLVGYNPTGRVEKDADLVAIDGTEGNPVYNVVIDHLSLTAADDGALDITGNVHDVTVSWCFLYGNAKDSLIKYDTRERISIHHNVYAHNGERNPQVKGDMRTLDFRNNIIYDWTFTPDGYGLRLWSAAAGSDSPGVPSVNVIGNAFIAKNASDGCGIDLIEEAAPVQRWVADNLSSPNPLCLASNLPTPIAIPVAAQVTTWPSSEVKARVLPTVGAPFRTSAEQALLDQIAGFASLTISDVQVTEGDGGTTNAVFTVGLSTPSGQVSSVDYTTADGTATAPADYTATAGTLSFPVGTTTRTVTVPVVGDLLDEPSETFFIRLSNPVGALIADAQGTGTIVDNDPLPILSIGDVPLTEGESGTTAAIFPLSLSAPSGRVVSVTAATADGTATAGSDYLPGTWAVVFPPGDTAETVNVPVRGDRVWEADETLTVDLSGAANATLGNAQGEGTILNDDAQGLSIADVDVAEPVSGTRPAVFTVTLSPTSASPVTVDYATTALSASAGSDYDQASGTLTFDPGVSTRTLSVTVRADALAEGVESFRVDLSGSSGAGIAYGQAIGRIHDPGSFFTLTPCRVLDTRNLAGPYGGPALAAGQSRPFTLAGRCGIPASARAASVNLTVTLPTAQGNLRLYPAGQAVPPTSTLNYAGGQTRANNAVVGLSPSGALAIRCSQATGTAHVILDVTGYFE